MNITIGGLTFIAGTAAATYTVESLSGWFDGVPIRREMEERPNAHGAFYAPGFLEGRVVSLSGLILTSSESAQVAAVRALTSLLADGGTDVLTVAEPGGSLTATVSRYGKPDVQVEVWGTVARYQVQFWAHDPRLYGPAGVFGPDTSVGVSHAGNFPAYPVVEVTTAAGMPSGYTVAAGGVEFVVSQALEVGETHRIETRTGWLYLDDVLQAGAVTQAATWTVPPGVTVTHTLTPDSGSGVITVTVNDTYM